jgi:hypothetical protein
VAAAEEQGGGVRCLKFAWDRLVPGELYVGGRLVHERQVVVQNLDDGGLGAEVLMQQHQRGKGVSAETLKGNPIG